jgi:hypothetical protein
MFTETKRVLALVALIAATGVAAVEMSRTAAHADPNLVSGGAAGYAGARVDAAFQLVAAMPVRTILVPMAEKGDLMPIGCAGPYRPEVAAECIDTAYEVEAEPSVVVETREGNTSILTRLDGLTVAKY